MRPRSRCERRSLRTLPGASLRPPLAFNTRPRRLSTPPDAFQLHPDIRLYGTTLRAARRGEAGETTTATFARGGVFALVTSEACLPSPGAGEGALGASLVINMETPKSREAYARRTRAGLGGGGRAGGGGGGGGVVLNVIAPHQLSALRAVLPDGVALDAMPIDLIDTLAADVAAGGRER